MSLLIGDIVAERIDPRIANAACNAGGKLLRVFELEYKYRQRPDEVEAKKELRLAAV